jgi:hypothetical protein
MSMSQLCLSPLERSRNAHGRVLQAMQATGTGVALSIAMGKSEATISRIKNDQLEDVLALLYHLDFKIVTGSKVCVDVGELNMLRQTYSRAVQNEKLAAQLFGGDE